MLFEQHGAIMHRLDLFHHSKRIWEERQGGFLVPLSSERHKQKQRRRWKWGTEENGS